MRNTNIYTINKHSELYSELAFSSKCKLFHWSPANLCITSSIKDFCSVSRLSNKYDKMMPLISSCKPLLMDPEEIFDITNRQIVTTIFLVSALGIHIMSSMRNNCSENPSFWCLKALCECDQERSGIRRRFKVHFIIIIFTYNVGPLPQQSK